jgi:16S rRNA (cytosine967-C5)-methyltransferase
MNVRIASALVISTVIRGESSLNSLIPEYIQKVDARDGALLQELCYGTLRHFVALDLILGQLMEKPIKAKETEVKALLLSALYQIRDMRTPPHAAVNETVAAVKVLKKDWARGLVNGVLRQYLRRRTEVDKAITHPGFNHMHPSWLADQLNSDWPDHAAAIMTANNLRPPMCLRVNIGKVSREQYLSQLRQHDMTAHPAPYSTVGIYLEKPCNVQELPGFTEGLVSVQDEAAQLCATLLDLRPGQRVLDACSAPGGKAGHLLENEPGLSSLVAMDVDGHRLEKVKDNLERLQLRAELVEADAGDIDSWWDGQPFDRILLDAPCSATGVIRRHPDIKLLRQPEDIVKLSLLQAELLAALWSTLQPGGKLLYATCSVLAAENDAVLEQFIATRKDCRPLPLETSWGLATNCGRQLFPQDNGHDGFYFGLLTKES